MPLAPAAIGIILNDDKTQVLLVKRNDVPLWVLPGGGIESNESPIEAVIREIHEETGLAVQIDRHCAEYTPVNRLASMTYTFLGHPIGGCLQKSNECNEVGFFLLSALPANFFFLHKEWLHEALTHIELVNKPITQINYKTVFLFFLKHPATLLKYLWTRKTKR